MSLQVAFRRANRIIANTLTRVMPPRGQRINFFLWLEHTGLLSDGILLHDGTPFLFHGYEPGPENYLFLLNETGYTSGVSMHDGTELTLHS